MPVKLILPEISSHCQPLLDPIATNMNQAPLDLLSPDLQQNQLIAFQFSTCMKKAIL